MSTDRTDAVEPITSFTDHAYPRHAAVEDPITAITDPPPESTVPTAPPEFGPVAKADRLLNLDFVRGVALLGILLVNVSSFFGPFADLMGGRTYVSNLPIADRIAVLFVAILVAGKFISQFSMMFGYGLLGQVERAHAAGKSPGGFAARRLGVLALFGFIHALGLWYGDVLFLYASLGIFVVLWRGNSAGSLLIIAGVLLGILVLIPCLAGPFSGLPPTQTPAAEQPKPPDWALEDPTGWRGMVAAMGNPTSPVWKKAETEAFRDGPWIHAQTFRTVGWLLVVISTFTAGWLQIVGMFALGAWMWRRQFFAPEQADLRRQVCCLFLPLGLFFAALATLFFAISIAYDSRPAWVTASICAGSLAVVTLPLGYVSALALLAEKLPEWFVKTVASAGRMALTVYLSETLIATFLSYHWGLQWFGITPWQQFVTALVIWSSLVVLSRLWLSYFNQGPMEWLWRRLEYGKR